MFCKSKFNIHGLRFVRNCSTVINHERRRYDRYQDLCRRLRNPPKNFFMADGQRYDLPYRGVACMSKNISESTLRIVAGYLDASSTVVIKPFLSQCRIASSNSYLVGDRPLHLAQLFGGAVYRNGPYMGLTTPSVTWVLEGTRAVEVARLLAPYSVARQRHFEIFSQLLDTNPTQKIRLQQEALSLGKLAFRPLHFTSFEHFAGFCDARMCFSVDPALRPMVQCNFLNRAVGESIQTFLLDAGLPTGNIYSCNEGWHWILNGRGVFTLLEILQPHVLNLRPKIKAVLASSDCRESRVALQSFLYTVNCNGSSCTRGNPELIELRRLRHNMVIHRRRAKTEQKKKQAHERLEEIRREIDKRKLTVKIDNIKRMLRDRLSGGAYLVG